MKKQFLRIPAVLLCLFCMAVVNLDGRPLPDSRIEDKDKKDAAKGNGVIKVTTEEVRLDAVVLDGRKRPVTDLTADDFEIYQDNVPQNVLSGVYIRHQSELLKSDVAKRKAASQSRPAAPIAPVLEREDVQRVIVFIVDDLIMSFEQLHAARMAMQRFAEKQMRPGDMAAIIRTGSGNSALNVFVSGKRELIEKIDKVRAGFSRPHSEYGIYESQLACIRYGIRALKDMPGRKTIIVLTPQPTIKKEEYDSLEAMFAGKDIDYHYMFSKAYDRMADEALRARVVVHVMDIRGLEPPAMDQIQVLAGGKIHYVEVIAQIPYRELDRRKIEALNPLPFKTGGAFVQDTNFFLDGVGEEVNSMMNGYYLISYVPPAGTFREDGEAVYHSIKIRVKRKGATVYSRDGFYGRKEEEASPRYTHPLQEAVFSPFLNKDLRVQMVSGFLDDVHAGYVLRSWLQVDARDVTIQEKPGEGYFASLQTVCLTADSSGAIQDARFLQFDFKIRPENISWIRKHGIRFSMLLPVKKPGSYYVRTAVKDMDSGKIGSAYQFIRIPDLKKNRLELSNIFIVNREEEAAWIKEGKAKDFSAAVIEPVLKRDERRNPAMNTYAAGETLQYMAVLYNARLGQGKGPDLEVQSVLYKNGKEVYRSNFQPLGLEGAVEYDRIPVTRTLALDSRLSQGDYVLELIIRDKNRKEKDGLSAQAIDFQIAKD